MKRIDMIYEIATQITLKDCNIDYKKAQDMSESILDMQMEKGMLPPSAKLGIINSTDNSWEDE